MKSLPSGSCTCLRSAAANHAHQQLTPTIGGLCPQELCTDPTYNAKLKRGAPPRSAAGAWAAAAVAHGEQSMPEQLAS